VRKIAGVFSEDTRSKYWQDSTGVCSVSTGSAAKVEVLASGGGVCGGQKRLVLEMRLRVEHTLR
jgi:hypothetical protein